MAWEYLPHDTRMALTQERLNACQNLGLILDRFNPWRRVGNRWDLGFRIEEQKQGEWEPRTTTGGEAKGFWLSNRRGDRRTRLTDVPLLCYPRIDPELLAAHHARWHALVRACGAESFELRTEARLVVGLGADSVLETALTLHRIYGYPFIPGSSLKGLARTLALFELAATLGVPALDLANYWQRKPPGEKPRRQTPLNKLEALLEADLETEDDSQQARLYQHLRDLAGDEALSIEAAVKTFSLQDLAHHPQVHEFRAVFGYLGRAGGVVFFDAVPQEPPSLMADVMNPHYPEYYRNEGLPHDADQPNPVSFLAVAEGSIFSFAVGPRRQGNQVNDGNAAIKARTWLEQALQEVGIGAKTAAGYGVFSERSPVKFRTADPEPRPPAPTPDSPKPSPKKKDASETEEVSEFAKQFARWLGTEDE